MFHHLNLLFALVMACASLQSLAQAPALPDTPKKPVTDTYDGGVQVTDDYRWLEDGKDPKVREWSEAQLRVTRAALDTPLRETLRGRFKELMGAAPVRYSSFHDTGGGLFALKYAPPKNQPMLVVMKSPRDAASERVLLDLNTLSSQGTTAIDFFVPSQDGRFVTVVLSEKGSEDGSAHVIDVKTGKQLEDIVPRVQYATAGGSVAWDASGEGFFYTRYPQGDERPKADAHFYQQVYYHRLGTSAASDRYELGKDFPRIAETQLRSSRDSPHILATVADGDGGEHAFYLRDPKGGWTKLADFKDQVKRMSFGRDGRIYAVNLRGAPRGNVLVLARERPLLQEARVIVPEAADAVENVQAMRDRIFVTYMAGGPSEIRTFDRGGKPLDRVPTPPVSSVGSAEEIGGVDLLVSVQGYTSSPAWHLYSGATGKLDRIALGGDSPVKFDDAEVARELAVSKDGTKIPINILMKKGTKLDGSNPVLLSGYGGYGISMRPFFSVQNRAWLDHGGIYVVANLRGGGEFGEPWHLAGNLTKKQNVFDDMIAAAEHLVKRGYTKPERLAAMGGSNGGLLMGAILTQRPDLFRAVVSSVGIYDMLRVELSPNGAFNVTEFGTVKDPAQFKALMAYSPYHHVKAGTSYPAVLFVTGENDGRVDPANSRKMTALMQASGTKNPVYLRVSFTAGHGIGTGLSERIEQTTDVYTFLMQELKMR
jgi:prolyl oligopeptidase